jgi:hypothetical protein
MTRIGSIWTFVVLRAQGSAYYSFRTRAEAVRARRKMRKEDPYRAASIYYQPFQQRLYT